MRKPLCTPLLAALLALPVHAADVPSQDGSIAHVVRAKDTLYSLAQSYLDDASLWPALQRANHVPNPRRLKPGSVVVIPADLLGQSGGAVVLHVSGSVTLVRGSAQQALQQDAQLRDGDVVRTAADGFVTLRLADGSIARVAGDSDVLLSRLKYAVRKRRGDTVIDLDRGRVEATVQPQQPTNGRFRIRTPLMAAGVRGTEFGVSVTQDGAATADVLEGRVDAATRRASDAAADAVPIARARPADAGVLVAAGQGTRVDNNGALAPVALLAAPDLQAVPAVQERPVIDIAFPAVEGARAYRAYLSRDDGSGFVEANARVDTPRVRFDGMADGRYVATIRAIDAQGIEGRPVAYAFVLKARPLPPLTLQPQQGELAEGSGIALRWAPREGASSYAVQVARDAAFTQPLVDVQETFADGSRMLSGLAPGQYFWRVRSIRATSQGPDAGPFGDTRQFTLRAAMGAPAAPVQKGDAMLFRWDGEPGQRFVVQIARDAAFTDMVQTLQTTERQAQLGGLPGGTYYLRVQATDSDGFARRPSEAQRFYVVPSVRIEGGGALNGPEGSLVERQ